MQPYENYPTESFGTTILSVMGLTTTCWMLPGFGGYMYSVVYGTEVWDISHLLGGLVCRDKYYLLLAVLNGEWHTWGYTGAGFNQYLVSVSLIHAAVSCKCNHHGTLYHIFWNGNQPVCRFDMKQFRCFLRSHVSNIIKILCPFASEDRLACDEKPGKWFSSVQILVLPQIHVILMSIPLWGTVGCTIALYIWGSYAIHLSLPGKVWQRKRGRAFLRTKHTADTLKTCAIITALQKNGKAIVVWWNEQVQQYGTEPVLRKWPYSQAKCSAGDQKFKGN
jgi:hypothetical protein